MTADEISANRAAAVDQVKGQLGLSAIQPSDWTYDQRVSYNKALAAYIQQNPGLFSATDETNAAAVAAKVDSPLDDNSFASDLAVFGDEFENQALRVGGAVASVGNGVINALNLAKYGIPAVILIFVAIKLFGIYEKERR